MTQLLLIMARRQGQYVAAQDLCLMLLKLVTRQCYLCDLAIWAHKHITRAQVAFIILTTLIWAAIVLASAVRIAVTGIFEGHPAQRSALASVLALLIMRPSA